MHHVWVSVYYAFALHIAKFHGNLVCRHPFFQFVIFCYSFINFTVSYTDLRHLTSTHYRFFIIIGVTLNMVNRSIFSQSCAITVRFEYINMW